MVMVMKMMTMVMMMMMTNTWKEWQDGSRGGGRGASRSCLSVNLEKRKLGKYSFSTKILSPRWNIFGDLPPFFFPTNWSLSSGLTDLWVFFESPKNLWLPWEIYWGVTYGVRREDRRQIVPTGVCERGEGRKIGRKKKKFLWGKNWPSTRFLEFEEKFSPLLSPDICWQFSWWWERQTWEELREWEVKWENKRQRFPTKKIQDPTLWRRTSGFAIKKYRDVSQVQLSTLQCTQNLALFQTLFQGCRPNINQSLDGAENNETLDTTSFSYRWCARVCDFRPFCSVINDRQWVLWVLGF